MTLNCKYCDDDGVLGVSLGDGQDYMAAGYHFARGDVAGDVDVVEISSQAADELDAGLIGTAIEVFEDAYLYHVKS